MGRLIGRALTVYAVLALAFWRAVYDYFTTDIAVGGTTYRVGDWLINYAGGLVRRGLFGELLLAASPPGQATLWVLAAFQLSCYAIVVAYAIGFLQRCRYSWSSVALVAGPAALAFVGWDALAGWRKEIIAFAVIAVLGWARRLATHRTAQLALQLTAIILFALAMFSWEASAFAVPMMLYLLRPNDAPFAWSAWARPAPIAIVAIALFGGIASLLAHGDDSTVAAICSTVIDQGLNPDLCYGAITMIGQPLDVAMAEVAVRFPLYWTYLWLLPLALLPVLVSPWLRRHWPWVVATALMVAPLYVVGQDYGRWAHLLAMAPALAIMAGDADDVASRVWNTPRTLTFLMLWGLPHWLFPDATWPLPSFFAALLELLNDLNGVSQ